MRESASVPALDGGRRASVHARVLGGFEVVVGGRTLTHPDWQRAAAERLVKLLLVTPGHCLPREIAAETLWPGGVPDHTRASLRKAIHFARRALGPSRPLVGDATRIGIDSDRLDLDLDRLEAAFETILAAGGAGRRAGMGRAERAQAARDVFELGALDLLPDDPYEDWLVSPRERLRGLWQRIALRAARTLQAAGRRDDAHAMVDELLARDPADEAAHRLALELYAAEGRRRAMRRQFELCRAALRELDAEPSAETRATFEASQRELGSGASLDSPGSPESGLRASSVAGPATGGPRVA